MARDLRLEFPGALYHVTSRGNAKQPIYWDDPDRDRFVQLLAREVAQQRWRCHAYCEMGNHYHLLIETTEPNLGVGMRRLNSAYAQDFNRRHGRVGHLLQGRYHAVLVERDAYLLELARYIVLNPVRAGMVSRPHDWPWSSYRATAGIDPTPEFLSVRWLLDQFHQGAAGDVGAEAAYRRFVNDPVVRSPWKGPDARGAIWLGSDAFRARMKDLVTERERPVSPRAQSDPLRPTRERIIQGLLTIFGITEEELWAQENPAAFQAAIFLLRRVGNLPQSEVASMSGLSMSRVSRIQRQIEDGALAKGLEELLLGD